MVVVADALQRGRESYARHAWQEACTRLADADRADPLGPEDLELLATASYMAGRDEEFVRAMERGHQLHVDAGQTRRAIRCAFWTAIDLFLRGETARATGWLGRAHRLLEHEQADCVERGYLLIPVLLGHVGAGDAQAAYATAAEAAGIAERFGDADLLALAGHEQGCALIRLGRVDEGLRLLDEAMLAATAGQLSPIVTGLVYCSVIDFCHEVYELRRAREWTAALSRWCEQQPELVAYTGQCLVHRAEIMQLGGAWPDALQEARRAGQRAEGMNQGAAQPFYRQAEIHRLRGELAAAERAYREASRWGAEPQPGLALLRLAQGDAAAAAAAIRRVIGEPSAGPGRARLLPAYVEIMLAVDAVPEARAASSELEALAEGREDGMLGAMAAHAVGAVDLRAGDPRSALVAVRRAAHVWQELEAPYEAARARVLVGLCCRELGDEDSAGLELAAARAAFAELGAAPDVARVDALARGIAPGEDHGLSPRELEVLRLVAAGATNRAIAAELVLSIRTVDRHVSNIFAKLGVSSRAGATARAYEHRLL